MFTKLAFAGSFDANESKTHCQLYRPIVRPTSNFQAELPAAAGSPSAASAAGAADAGQPIKRADAAVTSDRGHRRYTFDECRRKRSHENAVCLKMPHAMSRVTSLALRFRVCVADTRPTGNLPRQPITALATNRSADRTV